MPKRKKPAKPYRDFPLTAHANGQWCKKIRGKVHFFGVWSDPDSALQKYLDERDDLQAGRMPQRHGGLNLADTLNLWLERNRKRMEAGEITSICWNDYRIVCGIVLRELGRSVDPQHLRPADFSAFRLGLSETYSPSRITKIVAVTRMALRWAWESEHIEKMPRFGPDFKGASKKQQRLQKAQSGKKLASREDLHKLINGADPQWKAIILLCINGGLGNSDIARIRLSDLQGDWLDLHCGKTGVERRIPIWRETREAIESVIQSRRTPKPGAEELLFLSGHGDALIRVNEETGKRKDLTVEGFRRLKQKAGINGRVTLYWLRHTFQTIGDGAKDPVATSAIMGHADGTMAGVYRETISDDRLRAVTDHVRNWLWPARLGREDVESAAPHRLSRVGYG
jgi:integrase